MTPTTPPPVVHTDSPTCACEDCARVSECDHPLDKQDSRLDGHRRCVDCGGVGWHPQPVTWRWPGPVAQPAPHKIAVMGDGQQVWPLENVAQPAPPATCICGSPMVGHSSDDGHVPREEHEPAPTAERRWHKNGFECCVVGCRKAHATIPPEKWDAGDRAQMTADEAEWDRQRSLLRAAQAEHAAAWAAAHEHERAAAEARRERDEARAEVERFKAQVEELEGAQILNRNAIRNNREARLRAEQERDDLRAQLVAAWPASPTWTPTPENINALPIPLRKYIAALETDCDPAGTIRSNVERGENCTALAMKVSELEGQLAAAQAAAARPPTAPADWQMQMVNQQGGSAPDVVKLWPEVRAFAEAMQQKLEENKHKGNQEGWRALSPLMLLKRLRGETAELEREIRAHREGWRVTGNLTRPERIAAEAADVGNFAMMIADVVQLAAAKKSGAR